MSPFEKQRLIRLLCSDRSQQTVEITGLPAIADDPIPARHEIEELKVGNLKHWTVAEIPHHPTQRIGISAHVEPYFTVLNKRQPCETSGRPGLPTAATGQST